MVGQFNAGFFLDQPDKNEIQTPADGVVLPPKKPTGVKRWLSALASPLKVWESRISWRITITVFATLLLVQTLVLIFTANIYENEQLMELRRIAHTAIVPALEGNDDPMISPISKKNADKLFTDTLLEGISVYGPDYNPINSFGAPAFLQPGISGEGSEGRYRTADNDHYEVLFLPGEIRRPYNIVARINAQEVEPRVVGHIRQTLLILLLMSAFVTSVLMLVLSQWLLEPIILLRNNLLSAAKNPEKPNPRRLRKEMPDEVGTAVRIAYDLINRNAANLKELHKRAEDKIHKLAYFDSLTGLPNRTSFLEQLDEHIKKKVLLENGRLAVFSVDIDHFKDINDTMGHEIGDKMLDAVGKRLIKSLPENAVVSRAGADEFTVMVALKPEQTDGTVLADKIFAAMIEPISILQERFQVRVSIGVTYCPDDGIEAQQILKNTDIALNRAKSEGRDTVRYYSQDFDLIIQQRYQMLRDLRTALDKKQLRLHYHPQFDLKTGQLIGAEALLRWWKPDQSKEGGKFISPADFIPVAEQSGLIVPIGEYVLRTACETSWAWRRRGLPPIRIAVNISGVQFHRADIVKLVTDVLQETQIEPQFLELEVTESIFMENMEAAIDILNRLHGLGVELAVDDFGTGYSSLSYLRQFPIDRLKIDQSFIRNALINPNDRMIAKTIINLGHSLGLKVIAEGVETSDHEDFLKEDGCDEAQGFKYTKPIAEDQFYDYAMAHNRAVARMSKLSLV